MELISVRTHIHITANRAEQLGELATRMSKESEKPQETPQIPPAIGSVEFENTIALKSVEIDAERAREITQITAGELQHADPAAILQSLSPERKEVVLKLL